MQWPFNALRLRPTQLRHRVCIRLGSASHGADQFAGSRERYLPEKRRSRKSDQGLGAATAILRALGGQAMLLFLWPAG